MGDLTDDSLSDEDGGEDAEDQGNMKEVDRFGFTGGDQYTDARSENILCVVPKPLTTDLLRSL